MRHKQKELKVESKKLKSLGVATLLTFTFSLSTVSAQESVNATGGEASGSGGSSSYTVGQTVYTTYSDTGASVDQGVQQPYEISEVTAVEEAQGITLSLSVYPNPATDYLTLEVDASTTLSTHSMMYQLYDMSGKLLQSEKITGNQTSIFVGQLAVATYYVKVLKDGKEIKTFKVIKN